jgi:hypothetical protein
MKIGVDGGVCVIHLVNGKWCELIWLAGGRASLPSLDKDAGKPIGWDVVRLASLYQAGWVHLPPVKENQQLTPKRGPIAQGGLIAYHLVKRLRDIIGRVVRYIATRVARASAFWRVGNR